MRSQTPNKLVKKTALPANTAPSSSAPSSLPQMPTLKTYLEAIKSVLQKSSVEVLSFHSSACDRLCDLRRICWFFSLGTGHCALLDLLLQSLQV